QLAGAGRSGGRAAGAGGGGAGPFGAEQLLDGVTLGLGQLDQPAAHLGDGRALGQQRLALLGGGNQGVQLAGGKGVQVNGHQVLRLSGGSPSVGNAGAG